MTEAEHVPSPTIRSQPPPAPPLPPSRTSTVLQRIIAPLSFNYGTRPHGSHSTQSSSTSPRHVSAGRIYKQSPSQTTAHRTGIPIAALDLNKQKTHAILAGQEILKTVHINDGKIVEDFNLRSAISSTSTYGPRPDAVNHRREYLPAKDVRWSHGGNYDTIIATAALNGRIALYDVNRLSSSRVELSWEHDHTGQVNKLDFDPFSGYLLLSGSQDKTVNIWDIRIPKAILRKSKINIRHPVRDLKWSPIDVGYFALCTESGIVQRWDLRMPSQALLSINAHEKACYTIDWHPDGRHLVSGGLDKYVRVWDMKSENRRQKPAFQLRTPQGVMNLAWRPPCWSSEATNTGNWQCTQLATGYNDDDPRVHVWDLRRPLIPFREIDRYNSRPTDLVWASSDSLWTVGYEGMFTQTDIRYAAHVHEELPPCAIDFMPSGSFVTFTEDLRAPSNLSFGDPASGFLKIPQERRSGPTDGAISRSFSDDDAEDDHYNVSSLRRQSRTTFSRSAKSQGNTPPTSDGFPHVLSLDQSVLRRKDLFNNEQMGTLSSITGLATEPDVVQFLINNLSRPAIIEDRTKEPDLILERLEAAFLHNADVCDYASLHRMAQSWRILSAVVIPEIQDWADKNRKQRLENMAARQVPTVSVMDHGMATSSYRDSHEAESRPSTRSSKLMNPMFKGVLQSEVVNQNVESTSTMTTPLAMPLPDSPRSRLGEARYLSLHELVEPIAPLPPSVAHAHSTATAASKALQDDRTDGADSPHSSPERRRETNSPYRQHKRSITDLSIRPANRSHHSRSPLPQPHHDLDHTSTVSVKSRQQLTQEDRRAAIRDYRAQTRPLFTLDAPTLSPQYGDKSRQDSTDSFQMFSASTDSSSKGPSLADSLNSVKAPARPRQNSEEWENLPSQGFDSLLQSTSSERHRKGQTHDNDFSNGKDSIDFELDDVPGFSFGLDGAVESTAAVSQKPQVSTTSKSWNYEELDTPESTKHGQTAASSVSDGVFHFEQIQAAPKMKMHTSNPIRRMTSKSKPSVVKSMEEQHFVNNDTSTSEAYTYSDFQPIDFTTYEPKLPFAWSALPLVCHTVAFDIAEGVACALFSVHLLMHLHPFLFNQAFRTPLNSYAPAPDIVAERLMRPDLSYRVIEGIFLNHYNYLNQMRLYGAMAELRLMCVEFEYPAVYKPGQVDQPVGGALKKDPYQLQATCNRCLTLTVPGLGQCQNCQQIRDPCPVCLLSDAANKRESRYRRLNPLAPSKLWTFCQVCGHGAHVGCMEGWLALPISEGECPTVGCGCDCGPGLLRQQRLARQITEMANNEIIRGPRGGPTVTKRDSLRASTSPAVDKTRDTLRNSDLRDGGVQSGDETSRPSMSGRSNSRGAFMNYSRSNSRGGRESFSNRRVRLVTPGEEYSEPSQSLS